MMVVNPGRGKKIAVRWRQNAQPQRGMIHEKSANEVMLISEAGSMRSIGEQESSGVLNAASCEHEEPGGNLKFATRRCRDTRMTNHALMGDKFQQCRVEIDRNSCSAGELLRILARKYGASRES